MAVLEEAQIESSAQSLSERQAEVCLKLKRHIEEMPPGSRLPSVRQLMKQYGVGQISIEKVLGILKQELLLVTRPGDGTYKDCLPDEVAASPATTGVIELLVHDATSPFVSAIGHAFAQVMEEEGYYLRIGRYAWNHFPRPLKLAPDVIAVLVCRGMAMDAECFMSLENLKVPVVVLDVVPAGTCLDGGGTANDFGGAIAANHLIANGHKNLAVLLSEPESSPNPKARVEGFIRQAQLAGLEEPLVIHRHPDAGHGSVAIAYDTLFRYLKQGKPAFTGLFVDSDSGALGALKACHQAGLSVPEDMALIGFDDLPEAAFAHPSLTTLRQDLPGWAEQAMAIVKRRLSGEKGPPIQIAIPPSLIVRESTGGDFQPQR